MSDYRVLIRNNATQEERWFSYDGPPWEDHHHFMWTDGNYGCDCNLGQFFAEAGGEPDPDSPCGTDAYTPICAELTDGTRIVLSGERES